MSDLGWRLPVIIALMTLVGLTEGSSVALLLPMLSRMNSEFASNQGPAVVMLERGLAFVGATEPFEILGFIIAIAAIQMALFFALNWWSCRLVRGFQRRRQVELFRAFLRARWSFAAGKKVGELTNAIVTETNRLAVAYGFGLSILSTVVAILIYVAVSLLIAWPVVLSLVSFATVVALLMVPIYRKSSALGHALAPLNAELQSIVGEQLAGIKIVKAMASEDRAAAGVERLLKRLERANALGAFLPGTVRGVFEFLAIAGISIVFVLGNQVMHVGLGNTVVVLALYTRLFPRLTAFQANVHYLNANVHALAAIDHLQAMAEAEAERSHDSEANLAIEWPANLLVHNLDVVFENRKVLNRINLRLEMPGMVAIVGSSGAGKSTLVHALLGLVEINAGSISLGPYVLDSVPLDAWRRTIGYVPQETILFHASVRENLTLGNPDATDEEVTEAARRAHADKFIQELPQGYQTIIGDQGVKLSGGQRQRLGIARALLTRPALLLLDEVMSALDAESEADLSQTLEELRKQMGILIVAHRFGTIRTADSIYVFDEGRIVECGNWNELMARKSRLFSLAEFQSLDSDRRVEVAPIGNQ